MNIKYSIANVLIEIKSIYSYRYDSYIYENSFCHHHIVVKSKDIIKTHDHDLVTHLTVYHDDFIKARISSDKNLKDIHIEMIPELFDDPADAEYILIGIAFLEIALRYDYIPIHASAIVYHGEVILIAGPSGTGKSTLARMFCNTYKDAFIINDDKPLLSINGDQWLVHGTPFSGSHHIHRNESKPLKAIVFMKQSHQSKMNTLPDKDKVNHLFRNTYRTKDPHILNKTIQKLEHLIKDIPIYELEATLDLSPVHLIHTLCLKGDI